MSNTFKLLEDRHHVIHYKEEVPPKEVVDKALWEAWKTSPSKNNAMPWKVFVMGPEHKEEKIKVWRMIRGNHVDREKLAVEEGEATKTEGGWEGKQNPFYEHIKTGAYLFAIHAKPRQPNPFYEQQVKEGMYFDQAWESQINKFIDTSAVEVGMFIQNLSSFLLEKNIDVSYTSCFYRDIKKWHNIGLNYAEYRPIILMTCGYAKTYRKDSITNFAKREDKKPEFKEIVKWI